MVHVGVQGQPLRRLTLNTISKYLGVGVMTRNGAHKEASRLILTVCVFRWVMVTWL